MCGSFRGSPLHLIEFYPLHSGIRRSYYLLYSPISQYSIGAVSACTHMALQAAHDCMNQASGDELPFGCSLDVLEGVLHSGGKYRDTNHQDVPQALQARPDLTSPPRGLRIVSP
jgi:hypothetical protein